MGDVTGLWSALYGQLLRDEIAFLERLASIMDEVEDGMRLTIDRACVLAPGDALIVTVTGGTETQARELADELRRRLPGHEVVVMSGVKVVVAQAGAERGA